MNKQEIRKIEKDSIRKFMEENKHLLVGDVLDYGCGKMPYKDLVSGNYFPYDPNKPGFENFISKKYNTIICNQVIEYIPDTKQFIKFLASLCEKDAILILTYPTTWEEVEYDDFLRFTHIGMEYFLRSNGFNIIKHEKRAEIKFEDFSFAIGYGVVARYNGSFNN